MRLKRWVVILVVAGWMGTSPGWLTAQAVQAKATAHFAPVAPGESLPNLDKLKDRLRRYHDCTCSCGCYAKDLDAQATRAMAFLQRRAAHRQAHEKLALVLDIDETTLSNYAEMVRAGFAYDSKAFIDWEKLAAAPAIPGTLELYREAGKLGVAVFFLTGRSEPERATTEVDLRSQDFDHWQQLILRSPSQASATAQAYKSAERAAIRAQGYKIVLNVGDQWSDLRGEPEAEYSVKYPNPYYFIP